MVVLTSPYGQTSNQFFQHIHLDSFCRDNGIEFYNKFLLAHSVHYPNLKLQQATKRIRWIAQMGALLKLAGVEFGDELQNEQYKLMILKSKFLFCNGWIFRSHETTAKYRSYYQQLFDPAIDKKTVDKLWLSKTSSSEKIIGVHIRRGDYKTFAEGIYFYEDVVYIDKMQQLVLIFNNDCRFIIFSDDKELKITKFKEYFPALVVSDNTISTDHYLLSKCDYIIGPPSTFSLWASYIGETPCYHIYDQEKHISFNDFSVSRG